MIIKLRFLNFSFAHPVCKFFLKNIFFIAFLFTFFEFQAQTKLDANAFKDNISSKTVEANDYRTNDIILKWDFSNVLNKESVKISIEIQPLGSCWEELNGKLRPGKFYHKIENLTLDHNGELRLSSSDLNSKCFKWRIKVEKTSTNESSYSEWKFSSFM